MSNWKKIKKVLKYSLLSILSVIVILVIAFIIYLQMNKMKPAVAYSINSPSLEKKLLIATQGSRFKDAVTGNIANSFKGKNVYVRVEDVAYLQNASITDWNAVIVLNSCEYNTLHKSVLKFTQQPNLSGKLLLLATSGPGTWKPKNFPADTISSASKMKHVETITQSVLNWLKNNLGEF